MLASCRSRSLPGFAGVVLRRGFSQASLLNPVLLLTPRPQKRCWPLDLTNSPGFRGFHISIVHFNQQPYLEEELIMSSDESDIVISDDSDFEASPKAKKTPAKKAPAAKKEKVPAKPKAAPKTPKSPKKNADTSSTKENADESVFKSIDNNKKKTIEDIYQKKSQLEHILLRPDTYIGSVEFCDKTPMWVYDMEQEKMVMREISYVPGLYKIFDEILVNAADNKQRDPKMNVIKIDIDKAKNTISVYNNGKGIPVAHHKTEKMYVPELIFGTLLTSSNYNDDERKVTGGRNGYGAKLCNIFSTKFTLETSSKEYKKSFKQTWINNMTKDAEADIGPNKGDDFTKVTFSPDLAKFKMDELDDDIISLMYRRAYDVAGTSKGVSVFLNGKKIPVSGFKAYVDLYAKTNLDHDGEPYKVVHEIVNDRWEVAVTVSERNFQQLSFVNSIATTKGGRHVDYIADQIVSKMIDNLKKKIGKGGINLKPFQVKNHMWVFVNCLIENPTFDSQTKETMTLQAKSFGSKAEVSEKFTNAAFKSGITEAVMSWVKFKQQEQQNKACSSKKTTKLKGVPKLEDANDAGTKNSHLCTLILTEGDSAKTLAVAGLSVIGRDRYGVFPLRGKPLNVRESSHKQVMENAEINAVIKIIGLQYRLKYENEEEMKTLRYGKIMIMADQDLDGSHIKGLVINFIHYNWPALIRRNFVEEFITPIIKATKGKEEVSFFSIPEYVEWRHNTENWKTYRIKYYKGLGTSTSKEAKEYFSDMLRHRIAFKYANASCDQAMELAFSKKKVDDRKDWLTRWMEIRKERRGEGQLEEYLYDKDTRAVSYSDFINKELILFSNADNVRSIPCLVDGLKPGQRKVLFTCFKRADKKEVKVAQLAGAVGEMSAYHHGEASLMSTIVNLAQDYVGSNNINMLLPIGQFGTRLQGGKDSASPRYIFTQLNPVTKALFPSADENVLRFLYEENQRIEPEWYCPIIPTVLVNGAEGIGTGWSTKVPNYNPRELVANMRRLIRGEEIKTMVPWYKHFSGTIVRLDDTRFVCSGEIGVINDDTIEITELPVKTWTQNYKESVIEPLVDGDGKTPAMVNDFKEYHTDVTVRFVVKMPQDKLRAAESMGLHKVFKLQTVINTSSMVLFDAAGCLRRFDSPEQICREFFTTRKQIYLDRKAFLEGILQAQSDRLSEQARFIMLKIENKIHIENKKKAAIIDQLVKLNFPPDPVKIWKENQRKKELEACGEANLEEEEENEEEAEDQSNKGKTVADYDYLVGMAMWKLSTEDKDKLLAESQAKKDEYTLLKSKSWSDLWEEDLVAFEEALEKQEKKEQGDIEAAIKVAVKKITKDKSAHTGRGKKANIDLFAEVKPSKDAVRIEPNLEHMTEKYATKVKREPKVKTEKPAKKSEGMDMRQFLDKSGAENDDDSSEVIAVTEKKPAATKRKADTSPKDKPAKKPKAEPKAKSSKKKKADSDDDDDDIAILSDDDDDIPAPAPRQKAPRRAAAAAAKKVVISDDEEEDDPMSDDDEIKPKASKKKTRVLVSDDDDDDFFV
uniref:DNA topoisomerase 2 n=1 Tax=Panagrellus redivivus TaxID=6233 RepID=A0A7E4ZZX8_PANRE